MSDKLIVASALEAVLVLSGLVLLWRFALSPSGRSRARQPMPLPHWHIPGYVFGLSVLRVLGMVLLFPLMVASFIKHYAPELSTTEGAGALIVGFSLQIGLLFGLGINWLLLKSNRFQAHLSAFNSPPAPLPPALANSRVPLAGFATFLVMMALVPAATILWAQLLNMFGHAPQTQEVVTLFTHAKPGFELTSILLFAAIIAPIAEELAFRMGIFRYLRGRGPRLIVFVLPAVMFAAAHPTLSAGFPLFVFGLIQAVAYERTGRIAVPMIAHGLFNIHTATFILSGIDPYASLIHWLNR
jgi:membrane protease YdiL (CAAX protease family)